MARLLLCIGLFLFSLQLHAQEKCAFVPYQKHLAEISPSTEQAPDFESWLVEKKKRLKGKYSAAPGADVNRTLAVNAKWVIPVVVHVIHRGEAVGTGSNIPMEQIISQINTLNNDFRAKNQAEIDKLPAAFKALAADTEIEFVLAKQDPDGLPTDGVVRVESGKANWGQQEDLMLKQLSHWPASKYLNLYAATLAYPVLGWAQFPTSDKVPGLTFGDVAEETDGVVVDYRYFGSGYQANTSSKGRTVTHEVGHYFGLRHIWGDNDDCVADDYVDDTPLVAKAYYGCPTKDTDKPKNCAGTDAMYQNYLDYTDDKCMALFTPGQKQRMDVVLQYSPRRKDLHYSIGKEEPVLVPNDASVRALTLTPIQFCEARYLPALEVRNTGNNQLTQVSIALSVDNTVIKTYHLNTNLAFMQSQTFQLDEMLLNPGERAIKATITLANGKQDGRTSNNTSTASVTVPLKTTLPVKHNFETGIYPFSINNPDLSYTWQLAAAPNGITPGNKAAFINFYDYPTLGQKDILASPILDLRGESKVFLSFRIAHARFDRSSFDALEVYVSSDCRLDLQTAKRVYSLSDEDLATAPSSTSAFTPKDGSHWGGIMLDLSAYAGQENIQVLLIAVNDYGNNLYLDDIEISNNFSTPLNVVLSEIVQPSPVIGSTTSPLTVKLKNMGTETINTLRAKVSLNSVVVKDVQLSSLNLAPLSEQLYSLGTLEEVGNGPHNLRIQVYAPNGGFDAISIDNTLRMQFVVNTTLRSMPLRESYTALTFNDTTWTSTSIDANDIGWVTTNVLGHHNEPASTNFAALADFEGNVRLRDKWLVSPRFNLNNILAAGMQFWYYAGGENNVNLRLLASTDGGFSWPHVVWEKNNQQLKEGNTSAALAPQNGSLWRKEFLSLSSLLNAGQPTNNVRIALVATGEGSSSIYVDDIEFFLSDQPSEFPLPERNNITIFPNPARDKVNVFFNIEGDKGETVVAELINSQGSFISKAVFPNTLNQTYTFDLPHLPAGIYYIRIRSASINTTRKFAVVK